MNKRIYLSALLSVLCFCFSTNAVAEDYTLTINGEEHAIDLDKDTTITLKDGTKLSLNLNLKEFLRFEGGSFSFEHKNHLKPSRTDLGEGIVQTLMTTATGTGLIIQEYPDTDPTTLIDFMIKSLIEDEIAAGYTLKEEAFSRKVGEADIKGKAAITKSDDIEWTRVVSAHKSGKGGILIITFIEIDSDGEEQIIEDFWKTLKLK